MKMKEIGIDEGDECRWKRWVCLDLYTKVRKENCDWYNFSSLNMNF